MLSLFISTSIALIYRQDADDEKHDSTQSSKPDLSQSSKPNTPPKNPFGSSVASGISTHSPFKGFGIDQDKTVATTNSTNSPFKGFGNIGGLQDNSKTSATSIKVHGFSFASKSVAGVPSLPNTESDPQVGCPSSRGWFPLGVDCRRNVKNFCFSI